MSGRKWMTDDQQLELGVAVLTARRAGASWKMLANAYARDRVTLWRYAERAMTQLRTQECNTFLEECNI